MSGTILTTTIENDIAILAMDDGRANALGHAMIGELNAALDRAEKEAKAILIAGRENRFCAGFDLEAMGSGPESVRKLVTAGAELLLRLYEYRLPVVMACTGHALAAGLTQYVVNQPLTWGTTFWRHTA